jgi:putative two-component system response regulator
MEVSETFLSRALEIAVYHHERWDGTGYPQGLAGEAIPLSARIVAVADVYDALTSRRVYKDAWPLARQEIERGLGSHFDRRVAEAFLALLPQA